MEKLLKKMTLEQKASLMSGENFWNTVSIEELGIDSIMLTDGPHGVRKQGGKADHLGLNKSLEATCYPPAATLANSWDKELLFEVGKLLGEEAAHHDVSVLLGPGINIKRNPLCGRNFEYFSEDPYLTGALASSMITGIQDVGISACVKHFAVNSQEHIRMSVDEIVDIRALNETYLEAFRLSIKEGKAKSLMTSYNRVNGIFANEHPYLLKDVLRDKWNFDGLVVTDWGGNNDRVEALKVYNQLEMPSTNGMTDEDIVNAVKSDDLAESVLDENVLSLLKFIDDVKKPKHNIYDKKVFDDKAIESAKESIVLLKNKDNILPLAKNTSFALIGDFAENPRYQGAGSSLINPYKITSLLDVLDGYDYSFAKGYHRFGKRRNRLEAEAVKVARSKDVIVLSLGLDESREAEVVDRSDMRLSQIQYDLVERLLDLEKPIIVLLSGGAPFEMPFHDKVDGIIHGYLGGQASGEAMRQVLFGEYNPSGRLAETYPLKYSDVVSSSYYPGQEVNSEHRESIFIGYKQYDYLNQDVLYPFGYGLSYSDFKINEFKILSDYQVEVNLSNESDISGKTVIQIYASKEDSTILREKQKLVGFEKVFLEANESKTIKIDLYDHTYKHFDIKADDWLVEAGDYKLSVGFNSRDLKLSEKINLLGSTYNEEIPNAYLSSNLKNISKSDFEDYLGYKISNDKYDKSKALDYNSIILETRYHSLFGKFINWIIDSLHKSLLYFGKPIAANNVIFAQNLPFRGLARMSNGLLDMAMTDALMEMLGGHFFRGLKNLNSSFWRKRKNEKRRD